MSNERWQFAERAPHPLIPLAGHPGIAGDPFDLSTALDDLMALAPASTPASTAAGAQSSESASSGSAATTRTAAGNSHKRGRDSTAVTGASPPTLPLSVDGPTGSQHGPARGTTEKVLLRNFDPGGGNPSFAPAPPPHLLTTAHSFVRAASSLVRLVVSAR